MEDDEDDFYGGAGQKIEAGNGDGESTPLPVNSGSEVRAEQAEEESEEEEDSDDVCVDRCVVRGGVTVR